MANKIKYWHVMQPKRLRATFAIDVCDKATLLDLLNKVMVTREPAWYRGAFGIARVHPVETHYVKKNGRAIAISNAKHCTFNLMAVEPLNDGTVYKFAVETVLDGLVRVNFFTKPNSNVVHISFVDVTAIKRR